MLTCIGCPQNITCFYLVFIRDFCDSCDVILLVFSLLLRLSNDQNRAISNTNSFSPATFLPASSVRQPIPSPL